MCAKHDERAPEGGKLFTGLLMDEPTARSIGVTSANTVLGPIDARHLGVTLVAEALMYVLPGAQYAHDIKIDRAEVFDRLAAKLSDFKAAGGGTLVDATGMFEGRDLRLYEALSRATGVHIVASTGQGPEAMLGGYYLTPQTNPPTPWPAQKFAELSAARSTKAWWCRAWSAALRPVWWPPLSPRLAPRPPTPAWCVARPAPPRPTACPCRSAAVPMLRPN